MRKLDKQTALEKVSCCETLEIKKENKKNSNNKYVGKFQRCQNILVVSTVLRYEAFSNPKVAIGQR